MERWEIKRRLRSKQCRVQKIQPDSECQRKRIRSEGKKRRKRKGVLHWDLPNENLDLFENPGQRRHTIKNTDNNYFDRNLKIRHTDIILKTHEQANTTMKIPKPQNLRNT